MAPTRRRTRIIVAALAAALVAPLAIIGAAAVARAASVEPLAAEDCDKVRRALETGLPFGPGFRRLAFKLPKNDRGVEGQVCRLLTLGTGVHMEGDRIRSLEDMRTQIEGALRAAGWSETAETAKFAEKSSHGRTVFALARPDAICVTTIVVGVVEGAEPGPEAMADGKVRLGLLKPHEREWWLSVDCFKLEAPAPVSEAAPEAPAGAPLSAAPAGKPGAAAAPAAPAPMRP
ncbi:MAG: hypothetical protein ACE5GT_11660 [Rhodospirillales bacterium]